MRLVPAALVVLLSTSQVLAGGSLPAPLFQTPQAGDSSNAAATTSFVAAVAATLRASLVSKAGDTMTGPLGLPSAVLDGGQGITGGLNGSNTGVPFGKTLGGGYGRLVPGDATHPGYVEFDPASGPRLGFAGYADGSGNLMLSGTWDLDNAPPAGDNSLRIAPTSFVGTAITSLKTYMLGLLQANYTLQVPSAAALRQTAVFTGVLVHRGGFTSPGDGGQADYAGVASACPNGDDGGSCLSAPGGSWQVDWASVAFTPTPQLFGAQFKGDGSTAAQDVTGFQAAINTGLRVHFPALQPSQSFAPNNCLKLNTAGQVIEGDGDASLIIVNPSAALSLGSTTCSGLFQTPSGLQPGPVIKAVRIVHGQPDPIPPGTTSGASNATPSRKYLLSYVPDFYFRNTPGFKLLSVEDYACTVCVDMKSNSGGAVIDDFHFSAYRIGIDIDGSLDTVNISRPHWFPYFMGADQQALFLSEGGVVTGVMPHTNTGNGTFADSPTSNSLNFRALNPDGSQYQLLLGTYRFVFTSSTQFSLIDPAGVTVQSGIPVNTLERNVFNYQINTGSTAFAAGDEFDTVVNDIPSIGLNSARMDDLKLVDGLFLGGIGANFYQTPASTTNGQNGGTTGGQMSDIDFDTTSGLIMSQGNIMGSGVTFAMYSHAQGFDISGGSATFGNGFMIESNHDGKPLNHVGGDGTPSNLDVNLNNYDVATAADIFNVYQDGGTFTGIGNRFSRSPSATYVNPVLYMIGGYTLLLFNHMYPYGSPGGTGEFIVMGDSSWSKAVGNEGIGWTSTFPAGTTQGYYAGNN